MTSKYDIIINLLKEIDDNVIIHKTMCGSYTVKEMIQNIIDETEIGKDFSNTLLRISRDFLIRKVNKK